jgi:lysozyme family protein
MASFSTSYTITAKVEGGYANDPSDRGGETWRGIARKMHPGWIGWPIVDSLRQQASFPARLAQSVELQTAVLSFYKNEFWDALKLDYLEDQRVANELYDTAVNMGTGRAALFFQRVLNVVNRKGALFADLVLDGQIGMKTIAAFNGLTDADKYMVWKLLNCLQGEKYISICEANPSQEVFMRSWASRVFEAA